MSTFGDEQTNKISHAPETKKNLH